MMKKTSISKNMMKRRAIQVCSRDSPASASSR
jgi:hypothetical protein